MDTKEPSASPADAAAPLAANPAKTHQVVEFEYESSFLSCEFDVQGRFVFAGAQDNTVQRWELDSGKRTSLVGHGSWVSSMVALPDQTLLTGGYEGRLMWWPAAEENPVSFRTVDAHKGWIRALAVSPDRKMVATAGNDRLVKIWAIEDGTLIHTLAGHEDHVYNVAFHPDGQYLVSADLKLVSRVWSVADGSQTRSFDSAKVLHKYDTTFQCNLGGARSMAFTPDGKDLALGGIVIAGANIFDGGGASKPTAVLVDWKTGEKKLVHRPREPLPSTLWGLCFHPDGFWIGSTGGAVGGLLIFWRRGEADEFFIVKLPSAARGLALHPDNIRLALPHSDNRVRIFAMREKEPA